MKVALALVVLCGTLLASTAGMAQAPAAGSARDYPSRLIRIVVPFPPGGGADTLGRMLGQKLSESWGQPVIVENRSGANGTLGTAQVAKAPPDGYTLLVVPASFAVNPSLYRNLTFDSMRDLQPVTQPASLPLVVTVHPSVPAKSMKELIDLAKSRPGSINYASAGNGSPPHLATEQLKHMTGIFMTHIPYQGGAPALMANVTGEAPVYIQSLNSAMPFIKDGRLRALAVTSAKRSPSAPEIPTVAESGVPGYEVENWYGVFVTGGTPKDIVMKLHAELVRILSTPELKAQMAKEGATVVGNTPDQFAEFLKKEMATNAQLIKITGAKLD